MVLAHLYYKRAPRIVLSGRLIPIEQDVPLLDALLVLGVLAVRSVGDHNPPNLTRSTSS